MNRVKWQRLSVLILVASTVAVYFWTQSRYPDLNAKEMMAKESQVSDLLTAWPLLKTQPDDPYLKKIAYTTVNWVNENKKGMTFGVFMGSVFLVLFSYLSITASRFSLINILRGMAMGTPLAVCVNCAAPIFRGILKSKQKELALAAMTASPTLNIVILTMIFSVLPFYMAVTKVVFTLVFLFFGLPLISRFLNLEKMSLPAFNAGEEFRKTDFSDGACETPEPSEESLWTSAKVVFKEWLKAFKYIVVHTVPLMFLAGFLGAVFSHLTLDISALSEFSIGNLILVAFIGSFLPVPIGFDVILSNALLEMGLPTPYVLVLLCTLGIFSIYSAFIVWQSLSLRLAFAMGLVIFFLGIGVGTIGEPLHQQFYVQSNFERYQKLKAKHKTDHVSAVDRFSLPKFNEGNRCGAIEWKDLEVSGLSEQGVSIQTAILDTRGSAKKTGFEFQEGPSLGLVRGFRFGIRDYPDPFWVGRGTAAGDLNNDGWDDILFGTNEGVAVFANRGGWFEYQNPLAHLMKESKAYAVAAIDFNNDGWLDIFVSTFGKGNRVYINKNGKFSDQEFVNIPNGGGVLTVAPAFADLDGDSYIDVYNGNMALGIVTGLRKYGKGRTNSITYNSNLQFREEPLDRADGESMSTLISDLNQDGYPDIYVGNDFTVPDLLFLGQADGGFKDGHSLVEKAPVFSMAAESGDLNNDLKVDLSLFGTTANQGGYGKAIIDGRSPAQYIADDWKPEQCQKTEDKIVRENCNTVRTAIEDVFGRSSRSFDIQNCDALKDEKARQSCLLATMWVIITNNYSGDLCGAVKDSELIEVCQILGRAKDRYKKTDFVSDAGSKLISGIPSKNGNFILFNQDGKFTDGNGVEGKNLYQHFGGWTWSQRIFDSDNDGWQDIFNAEGAVRQSFDGFNTLLLNKDGKKFENAQFTRGATHPFGLYSFVTVDFDNDGDLDIIGNSAQGPVQVYRNQTSRADSSVIVELEDQRGNRFGIGAKIIVETSLGKQYREIKAGGGYQSYDAPKAHFGLGQSQSIERISISWRDGSETVISGPIAIDQRIKVRRKTASTD